MALTVDDIVQWMLKEINAGTVLDHGYVIGHLAINDPSHIEYNNNGNPVLPKSVLNAFRKATPDDVVWSRSDRHWRQRIQYDPPGRMVP